MTASQDNGVETKGPGQEPSTPERRPAEEKAAAEISKIRRETEKLEKEIAALQPADLVLRKTEAEIEKTKLDAAKLARENRLYWIEPIKAVSGLSSILLALIAVGTLWINFDVNRQAVLKAERDAQRAERELVSSLIRDLGAEQQSLRASSARRLGAYVNDANLGPSAIGSLRSAVALEPEGEVQDAILQALESAGQRSLPELARTKSGLDGEIATLFSNVDPSTLVPDKTTEKKIRDKQQAFIKITLALARGGHCTSPPCSPDFKNAMSLRRSLFFSYRDLKGASFENAAAAEADFYGVDLSRARFDGARLDAAVFVKAKLTGARFDRANMRIIKRGKTELARAQFEGADLTDATFVDACLGGADFTGSIVDPAALARGFTQGIQIEPEKLSKLGPLRSDDRCHAVQE